MWFLDTTKGLIASALIFVFLVVYLYFMSFFIMSNILWIFTIAVYFLLFIIRDNDLKEREKKENIKIRKRKDIRIPPY